MFLHYYYASKYIQYIQTQILFNDFVQPKNNFYLLKSLALHIIYKIVAQVSMCELIIKL